MNLPTEFIQTIINTFGTDGETWLSALPDLISEASLRWDLKDIQPVPHLSYNFLAFSRKVNGSDFVLKIGVLNSELTSEIAALTAFNGDGAVRILDSDAEKGMFLLERIQPGRMLAAVMDDDLATQIAADVMLRLWRPAPDNPAFIRLADWFDGLKLIKTYFNGGIGPFPRRLLEIVEALLPELLAAPQVLLHGDFHHYNILESERGWLVIDPKGVIGPKGYEAGPLLINPFDRFLNGSNPKSQTERRIAILSEKIGLERGILRSWGICHAILSAWWSIADNDANFGDYALDCAEIIASAKV